MIRQASEIFKSITFKEIVEEAISLEFSFCKRPPFKSDSIFYTIIDGVLYAVASDDPMDFPTYAFVNKLSQDEVKDIAKNYDSYNRHRCLFDSLQTIEQFEKLSEIEKVDKLFEITRKDALTIVVLKDVKGSYKEMKEELSSLYENYNMFAFYFNFYFGIILDDDVSATMLRILGNDVSQLNRDEVVRKLFYIPKDQVSVNKAYQRRELSKEEFLKMFYFDSTFGDKHFYFSYEDTFYPELYTGSVLKDFPSEADHAMLLDISM